MPRRFDWGRLDPRFWLQNESTNWEWDKMLNDLLDRHQPVPSAYGHTVSLGNMEVWTSNWPYAYGSPRRTKANVLPSVATRKRLRAAIGTPDPLEKVRLAVKDSLS